MQFITASMLTKTKSAEAPVIGSSFIVEQGFVANVALDVAPSIEVEPHADLHMREVSESLLHPPLYLRQPFPPRLLS